MLTPLLDYVPEKAPIELINIPEYWRNPSVRPRGFTELCDMIEPKKGPVGIWEFKQWDPRTGEIRKREVNFNVVTDDGAIEVFKAAITNAFPSNPFNNIYINNNSGSTLLTTALTNGQTGVTSLAVSAIPAAIPSTYPSPANANNTQLQIGYGTGQTQTVTASAASQGATSITTTSFTSNAAYAIGTAVVPLPNVQENPSNANLKANQSSVLEQYSGNLSSGAYTYTPTTGAGNRSVTVSFVFKNSSNGGSTANGNYTDSWLVNLSSAAGAGNYVCHEINTPLRCDNNNNITTTFTLKW